MTYIPKKKNIEPSIKMVLDLMNPATYIIKLKGHHLNNRIFELTKGKKQYDFHSSSPILKGLQSHKEIQFKSNENVELKGTKYSLYSLGKHILVNQISYDDTNHKIFTGGISSFISCKNLSEMSNKYHRYIIPLGEAPSFNIHSFQRQYFTTPNKSYNPFYISLKVIDENYHLFNYKLGATNYLIIDGIQSSTLNQFQKKCFNILLALGFIKGNLIHDECFILSFKKDEMDVPDNIVYHSMRSSVYTNQSVFTANPFSVNHDIDFERGEDGHIKKEVRDKLYEDIYDFPSDVFSNLASQFYEYEKLQRAVLIFIQSHTASLEIKIPNYYVSIEAITSHIIENNSKSKKQLTPIKDKKLAAELIKKIKEIAIKVKKEKSLNDEIFDMDVFIKNINKLNAPPNADKLTESFTYLGYKLSKEQINILKNRNRFLHGSFLKTVDDDTDFREGLHTALRLQFMIALLTLKLAGFTGKIINYAELWSHVTEKKLNEDRLVKI